MHFSPYYFMFGSGVGVYLWDGNFPILGCPWMTGSGYPTINTDYHRQIPIPQRHTCSRFNAGTGQS